MDNAFLYAQDGLQWMENRKFYPQHSSCITRVSIGSKDDLHWMENRKFYLQHLSCITRVSMELRIKGWLSAL